MSEENAKSENNENNEEGTNFVTGADIVHYMFTQLTIFIVGTIMALTIAIALYKTNPKISTYQKIFIVLLPIIIGYIIEFLINSPQPLSKYLLSKFNKSPTKIPFDHKMESGIWPFVGSSVITIDNVDCLFIGGGRNQQDVLLKYDKDTNTFNNIIQNTGLEKLYKNKILEATYCATSFDFKDKELEDIVIGYEGNVILYEQVEKLKFVPHILANFNDKNPLSITIADYNKDKKADIYISCFILSPNYKGTIFNDESHNKSNILLKNITNNGKLEFIDVTKITKSKGISNTFTSAFVDLDNRGYPDIVLSHDSSKVEILKNIDGKYFESIIPYNHKGNWMGLGIGDINNNGKQDLFLTNIGTNTTRDRLSLGDIQKGQKQTFAHVLLQNKGDFKFDEVSNQLGIYGDGFGWGVLIADFDLDSNNDVLFGENFLLNPMHWVFPEPGHYYKNNKTNFSREFNLKNAQFAQTPLLADLDGSGLMDVVWINTVGNHYVYFNYNPNSNNFISIKLPKVCKYANSTIVLETNNKKQYQYAQIINGGTGFGCGSSPNIVFGLGLNTKVNSIKIKTIYGDIYEKHNPSINKVYYATDFTKSLKV